jgi:hypothetical protein
MMRSKIALTCLLIGAQPAEACHRFSQWYYPYPQRCSTSTKVAYVADKEPAKIIPDVFPPIKPDEAIVVTIPQVKPEIPAFIFPDLPSTWEEIQHEAGLTKLRLIQQGNWRDR